MKLRWLALLTGLGLLAGCSQNSASVSGMIENSDGENIVLERLSSTEVLPIDSIEIEPSGNFELNTGPITEPGFYRLRMNQNNFVILLLDKGEEVELTGNALDFYQSYTITGSDGSVKLRSLDKTLRADFEKVDSLRKIFQLLRTSLNHFQRSNSKKSTIIDQV